MLKCEHEPDLLMLVVCYSKWRCCFMNLWPQ